MADVRGALAAWAGLVLNHVNQLIGGEVQLGGALAQAPVSYTHLTLPTILRV